MRVAVPAWQGRVSPVLDVAGRVRLFDIKDGVLASQAEAELDGRDRVRQLASLGVKVLICGAVSRQLESGLAGVGIHVIPEVCGPVDAVVRAYLKGRLCDGRFATPGAAQRERWARRSSRSLQPHGPP